MDVLLVGLTSFSLSLLKFEEETVMKRNRERGEKEEERGEGGGEERKERRERGGDFNSLFHVLIGLSDGL